MKKYYFLGIGGIGMSGLAHILLQDDHQVEGSDCNANHTTSFLEGIGALIRSDEAPFSPTKETCVVYSSAIAQTHPHLQQAQQQQCQVIHRSELLGSLMEQHQSIAVAGTHGKTFTSALLVHCLDQLGLDPSYSIGGIIGGTNSSGKRGQGPHFVAEADESDGSFVHLNPTFGIVTNIDDDHLDHYKTSDKIDQTFVAFYKKLQTGVYCRDCPRLKQLGLVGTSYGFSKEADVRITEYQPCGFRSTMTLSAHHQTVSIEMPYVGRHLATNTAGVIALLLELGCNLNEISLAISAFPGIKRRQEVLFDQKGITLIDDYAHHPTEIQATLEALSDPHCPRKKVVLFQPHRSSRIDPLIEEYTQAFAQADQLYVFPIYQAGESPGLIDHNTLFDAIDHPCKIKVDSLEQGASLLKERLYVHDLVVSLGAGNINHVLHTLQEHFAKTDPIRYKLAVLYGGPSLEHDITKLSFEHLFSHLNPKYYDTKVFYITKDGKWFVDGTAASVGQSIDQLREMDLCFPVFHSFGEDGIMQGVFEMLDLPYAGSDVLACASCMNKEMTKKLAAQAGVASADYVMVDQLSWKSQQEELLFQIKKIKGPWVVKPVNLGSSIGVRKIEQTEDLEQAIDQALKLDTQVLVEEFIQGREVEIGVVGNDALTCTLPVEILKGDQIFDMDAKYYTKTVSFDFAPELSHELIHKLHQTCKDLYKTIGCSGFCRIDLFIGKEDKIYLIEANPIPGFTQNSRFSKMFDKMGIPFATLLDTILILALSKFRKKIRYVS